MSLRVPKSVATRWQVFCVDWRSAVRAWMVENAPKSFAEEMSELEASRVRGEAPAEPSVEDFDF